jgi:hypothetical protein
MVLLMSSRKQPLLDYFGRACQQRTKDAQWYIRSAHNTGGEFFVIFRAFRRRGESGTKLAAMKYRRTDAAHLQ